MAMGIKECSRLVNVLNVNARKRKGKGKGSPYNRPPRPRG